MYDTFIILNQIRLSLKLDIHIISIPSLFSTRTFFLLLSGNQKLIGSALVVAVTVALSSATIEEEGDEW